MSIYLGLLSSSNDHFCEFGMMGFVLVVSDRGGELDDDLIIYSSLTRMGMRGMRIERWR